MSELKQSTSATFRIGPFVDSTDGVTPETGLTINQSDILLSKNGAGFLQKNQTGGATHDTGGWYEISLNSTDTNTNGSLEVSVNVAGAAPVWKELSVLPANTHDAKYLNGLENLSQSEVGTEVNTSLVSLGLDHLLSNSVAGSDVANNSIFAKLVSKSATADWDTFNNTTDSLEAQTDTLDSKISFPLSVTASGQVGINWADIANSVATVDLANTDFNLVDTVTTVSSAPTNWSSMSIDGNGRMDIGSLIGDTTSVTNLKNQYDGTTGLTGPLFPATQDQIGSISTSSGLLNTPATGFTGTVGVIVTGTFTDTETVNGVYHQIEDVGGTMDIEYLVTLPTQAVAASVEIVGFLKGGNDTLTVQAWDWNSSQWDIVGDYLGQTSSTNVVRTRELLTRHTGSGADQGKVRFRFEATTLTSADLHIDRLSFAYTTLPVAGTILHSGLAQGGSSTSITLDASASSIDDYYNRHQLVITGGTGSEQAHIITEYNGTTKVATVAPSFKTSPDATSTFDILPGVVHSTTRNGGYDNGAVYISALSGNPGTTKFINGTTTNPSDNLTDAKTIADEFNITELRFLGAFAYTLDQSYNGYVFNVVSGQFFILNGQDISGSIFMKSGITGNSTASSRCVFDQCGLEDVQVGVCNMVDCGLAGDIELVSKATFGWSNCFENVGGASINPPTVDMNGDNVTAVDMALSGYNGRLNITGMTPADSLSISGNGVLTFDASCTGGNVYVAGDIKVVDNSSTLTVEESTIGDIRDKVNAVDVKIPHTMNLTASGNIGTDQANIENPTSVVDLSGTSVKSVNDTVSSNVTLISGDSAAATNLSDSTKTIGSGQAIAGTLSSTEMTTNLTGLSDDQYKNRVIYWIDGPLEKSGARIESYNSTTGLFTFTETTNGSAPVAGNKFLIQ